MALVARAKSVTLNGVDYAVVNGQIQVEPFNAWAEPVRTIGNQRRGDRVNANQWVFEDLTYGLGFFTTQGDPPINGQPGDPSFQGFFNSTLETRWSGQVTLPGLIESVSHTKDAGEGSNHTYTRLFEAPNITTPVSTGLYAASYTASQDIARFNGATDNFDVFEALGANEIYRCIFEFEGKTYLFGGADSTQLTTTGHITFGGVYGNDTPTFPDANHVPFSGVTYRGVAYILAYNNANGTVTLWSATNPAGTWTDETITLSCTGWRNAELVVYRDASGRPALFAYVDSGLYLLDLGNQEALPAIEFGQRVDEQLPRKGRPIVHKGRLYIPRGQSLWEYHFTGAYRDISPLTQARIPTGADGFKPAVGSGLAQITAIASGSEWLFVAFSGHTKGSVWAYDGAGYHYIWSKLSGDTDIYDIEDIAIHYDRTTQTPDLFVLFREENGTDNCNFEKIEGVLEDPKQISGKKYASEGYIITPHTDGGMSEVDSVLIQIGVGAGDLVTNEEFITVETEVDFAGSWGNSRTFDPINPSIQKLPATAAVGEGLSGKRWRHRITLKGHQLSGTNTDAPIFYNLVSYYEKVFPDMYRYTFEIDMRETMRINRGKYPLGNPEDILDLLKTARSSVVLLKFEYGGETEASPRYVRVKEFPHIVSPPNAGGQLGSHDLDNARILVTLEERVP